MDSQELFPWACEVLWATVPSGGGPRKPIEETARAVLRNVPLTFAQYDWILRHVGIMARDADAMVAPRGMVS